APPDLDELRVRELRALRRVALARRGRVDPDLRVVRHAEAQDPLVEPAAIAAHRHALVPPRGMIPPRMARVNGAAGTAGRSASPGRRGRPARSALDTAGTARPSAGRPAARAAPRRRAGPPRRASGPACPRPRGARAPA